MSHYENLAISEVPSLQEQARFHESGIETDELGRPLHPWRDRLPDLEEGKGFYWRWGPNYTVDPIIITREQNPQILLIKRSDNGKWALPGGFIDDGEAATAAGIREVQEETGLVLGSDAPELCYRGPVRDQRSRLHAWSDTTALLWRTSSPDEVHGGDDAQDAQWVPLSELSSFDELHGSHATLIDMAIRNHGSLDEQLEYFGDTSEIVTPKGGHMGYIRLIASLPSGARIFVKRHDTDRFTDSVRAEHSKRYLRKEYHVYQQLQRTTIHVPGRFELKGDHTLLLEAYDARDGWHWKSPEDEEARRRYIQDVIAALKSIEPLSIEEFDEVNPSYQSIVDEGWGSYELARDTILDKLRESRIEGTDELADELDILHAQFRHAPTPVMDRFAHFDIRQSNITWHPEHGVRIVDWSWAGTSPSGVDTTSILIDLAKVGYDVDDYADHFDSDYARTLIGFWLGHSVWPTPTNDQTIRDHQIASAVAAHRLFKRLSK